MARATAPGEGAPFRASVDLLDDGALALRVHPSLAAAAAEWIPLDAPPSPAGGRPPARIRVVRGRARPFALPPEEPTVQTLNVDAWVDAASQRARLGTRDGVLWGTVDLARRRAAVAVREGPLPAAAGFDLSAALTVSAALLLGRLERVLLHAAAVVAPDGRAWLLVGDTRSGKTSSCVNLIRAGWDWLADDQVVARADAATGEVVIEGWPGRFTLDDGFEAGRSLGRRTPTEPWRFGPGRLRRDAPLGGVLLPRVRADEPTRLEPAHPADALGQLIRQSPWLLADPHAAPRVLALLTRMAKTPVFRMTVGNDTYGNPRLLQDRVAEAVRFAGPGGLRLKKR
jgi:hypothetical protein